MKTQKRKTWRSKLTRLEMEHLKEAAFEPGKRIALKDVEKLMEHMAIFRAKNDREPCWMCRGIARKLDFLL